jgi:hypothetical protein
MTRAVYLILALVSGLPLLLARGLVPSTSGFGTHRQLGLPACEFLTRTGWPCPSCGLTTSFALAAQGRWYDAAMVQPFGFVLFVSLVVAIPLLGYAAARRVPLRRVFEPGYAMRGLGCFGTLYVAAWLYRLYL